MAEHEAGRELDALVAEKVMGLTREQWIFRCYVERHERDEEWCYNCTALIGDAPADERVPNLYSTDIAAAWQVVEKMRVMDASVEMMAYRIEAEGDKRIAHRVVIWGANRMGGDWSTHVAEKAAATMPLAICLAALACVTASEPK